MPNEKKAAVCRVTIFLVVVAAAAVLGGCASLAGLGDMIQRPEVRIIAVVIEDLTFERIRLRFDVEITNPNPVGVQLAGFDYLFEVDQARFVEGVIDERFGMEARGTSIIPVPVEFTFEQLLSAVSSLADRDKSEYQLTVGLSFQLPVLDTVRVSASRTGEIPVIKVPMISVRALQIKRLTLQGATLVLGLDMVNPNGFLLSLKSLDYQFSVGGQRWASGALRRGLRIGQKDTARLDLPIELSFSGVGQSVRRILTGRSELGYELSVEMEVATDLPLLPGAKLKLDRSGEVLLSR